MSEPQTGLVVAAYGRHCLVESPDGERRIAAVITSWGIDKT